MPRPLTCTTSVLVSCAFLLFFQYRAFPQNQVNPQVSKDSLSRFAGRWQGQCQDGRTFVVLSLQPHGNQLDGTVSIGNMHGDDEGACMLVTAPPVPEHAQKITEVVANHNVVSFNGSKRPDGTLTRFELTETAPDKAELKLLDTPVAQHPWLLVKSQKPE